MVFVFLLLGTLGLTRLTRSQGFQPCKSCFQSNTLNSFNYLTTNLKCEEQIKEFAKGKCRKLLLNFAGNRFIVMFDAASRMSGVFQIIHLGTPPDYSVMNYNNSVLIGNWSEERLLRECEFKLFLRKRDRRELLLQRSRTLFSNLLCERPLALSGAHLMIGYNTQVIASDMPAKAATATSKAKYGLALSSLVSARQVDFMQNINDGCLMTLSPITTPCSRNTYVIESNNPSVSHGSKLTYGQEFLLRAENYGDPTAPPLYVKYVVEGVPTDKVRMPIHLSAQKESSCRWMAIPLMKRDRLEALGSPVKTGEKLLIKNCVSDTCLSVMNQSWLMTFFGPECGVNCQDFVNIHKRHTAENIFTLVSDVAAKSQH